MDWYEEKRSDNESLRLQLRFDIGALGGLTGGADDTSPQRTTLIVAGVYVILIAILWVTPFLRWISKCSMLGSGWSLRTDLNTRLVYPFKYVAEPNSRIK